MRIQCRTLFDCSYTGTTGHFRPSEVPFEDRMGQVITNQTDWNHSRNQQRNWETVLQTISLTAQPLDITPASGSTKVSLSEHQFGSIFKGLQNCWKFMFYIEQQDVFGLDPIAKIESNFDQIPIIGGLTESVKFETPLFQTRGDFKNIYFKVYSNLD